MDLLDATCSAEKKHLGPFAALVTTMSHTIGQHILFLFGKDPVLCRPVFCDHQIP